MEVNEVILTSNEIIEKLNNINNEWLKDIKLTKKQLEDIISCINSCTSPKKEDIFKAFSLFNPSETRVLILGQDPYPDNDKYRVLHYGKRAHGLAFSFKNGQEPAEDSLLNIFKAIDIYKNEEAENFSDIYAWNTNLEIWARNNKILLLNTALTYCDKISKKDRIEIWKPFIEKIILNILLSYKENLVIFLWGKESQNLFLSFLNSNKEYEKINEISNKIKEIMNDSIMLNKRNNNFNKQKTIKRSESIEINSKIKIFMTNHPSFISENNEGKFVEYSSKSHFKACDEFLTIIENGEERKLNIWKNFPKNNQ